MFQGGGVAVDLGALLSSQPLARFDANAPVIRLQRLVVRDVEDVVGEAVGLSLPRTGVLVRESWNGGEPFEHGRFRRHPFVFADRTQRPPVGNLFADGVGYGLVEFE